MPKPIRVEQQFTEEQKDKVIKLYSNNATQKEIAEYLGVPRRTAMKLCHRLGLERNASEAGKLKIKSALDNPETLQVIEQMRNDGKTLAEIVEVVGGSISAVHRLCDKYKLSLKNVDYEAAARGYNKGLTLKQLAEMYGVSSQSMHAGLKKQKVKFRPPIMEFEGHKPRSEKLNKDTLVKDYERLGSLSKVAEKNVCTLQYVKNVLVDAGIQIRTSSEVLTGSGNPFFGKKHPSEIARACAEIGAEAGKKFWENNPDYAVVVAAKQKAIWADLEKRKAHSELISRLRKEGKCNSFKGEISTRFGFIKFDSSYELALIELLEDDCRVVHIERDFDLIEYDYNGARYYVPDFRIWLNNGDFLIVEVKSDWYAKQPKEIEKIKAGFGQFVDKFAVLNKENIGEITARIDLAINPLEFDFSDITILEVSSVDYLRFYGCFHYLGRTGRRGFTLGAYISDRLIACCTIAPISRNDIAKKQGVTPSEIRELARFCVHPDFHKKNLGSWFLSRATKTYKNMNPNVIKLVSFADTTVGHQGTIYKAAGWEKDGEVKPNYHYVKDNKRHHKKRIWDLAKGVGVSEKEYAINEGFQKVKEAKKIRFVLNI